MNDDHEANAFTNVSCTRSAASAGFRVMRMAAAYSGSMNGSACASNWVRASSAVSA